MTPSNYSHPLFIADKTASSGYTKNLAFGQVGFFEYLTGAAVSSTTKGSTPVVFATGSYHTVDKLGDYNQNISKTIKTVSFLPKDIVGFRKSSPISPVDEQVVIGYDGTNPEDSLTFLCGQKYTFQVRVWGEGVNNIFTRPIVRTFTLSTECCDENCTSGCTPIEVGHDYYAKKLADLINNDVELGQKGFVTAEAIISTVVDNSETYTEYTLELCDNGDIAALGDVQAAYIGSGYTITRKSRVGSLSTYTLKKLTGAPTAFTPTLPIYLEVCGSCPSGYSAVDATDTWLIKRPLVSGNTLTSSSLRDDYADAVGAQYASAFSVTISDANKTFIANTGSVALVQIIVPAGTAITALLADEVSLEGSRAASCTPSSNTTTSWVAQETWYRGSRTLHLTVNKDCGGSNMLTEVRAAYASAVAAGNMSGVTIVTAGTCSDVYSTVQYSDNLMQDGCLTNPTPIFSPLQPFNGIAWTEYATSTGSTSAYAGVRLTGSVVSNKEFIDSFLPTDYYSVSPLRLSIEQLFENGDTCNVLAKNVKMVRGVMSNQTGHFLKREFIKGQAYTAYGQFFDDVRTREVLDQQGWMKLVDTDALYTVYYLRVKQNADVNTPTVTNQNYFEYPIWVKAGTDTVTFESYMLSFLTRFGIDMTTEA